MASSNISAVVVPLAVPVVTALVGAAGIVIKDITMRKNQDSIRTQACRDARDQVKFVREWWAATQAAQPPPQVLAAARTQANLWLEQAANRLSSGVSMRPATDTNRNLMVRLLLLYKMTSRSARVLRVFFYLSFAFLAMGAIATAGDTTSSAQVDRNYIGSDIAALGVFALLTLIMGFAASQAEVRAVRNDQYSMPQSPFPAFGAPTYRGTDTSAYNDPRIWQSAGRSPNDIGP